MNDDSRLTQAELIQRLEALESRDDTHQQAEQRMQATSNRRGPARSE
jgi:hypothetical protein